jgi:hypothetical protein
MMGKQWAKMRGNGRGKIEDEEEEEEKEEEGREEERDEWTTIGRGGKDGDKSGNGRNI